MSSKRNLAVRVAATATATGLLVLTAAGVASAHVTAHSPDTLSKGSFAEIVFRVPDEEDTAHTVKLQVNFSATKPVAGVSIKPVAGWTAQVTMMNLPKPVKTNKEILTTAVKSITWTAPNGAGIAPGQFDEFPVTIEGLPNTNTMIMPAVQTYDNGDIVRWDQVQAAGQSEPEHPAPHLDLVASDTADTPAAAAAPATVTTSSAAPAASSSDGTARWLASIGIIVAAIACGFGIGAFARRHRTSA
ncbi:MAG TPA: YcnI family protein [Pseudonocardiaceae bacterium]|nr:YcnI family protein [Pseudonocardiaceae bacterium]